jgi:hypothetical protein
MQPNEIILAVDEDNDGGTTAAVEHTYSRSNYFQNKSEYISETHTLSSRDKLALYRTLPKRSGNFLGMAKTAIKFTQDISVAGVDSTTLVVAPGIVDVAFSMPVGVTSAQSLALRMRAVALLLDDDVMSALVDQQMV